jgi:hypothetical protein
MKWEKQNGSKNEEPEEERRREQLDSRKGEDSLFPATFKGKSQREIRMIKKAVESFGCDIKNS